MPCFWLATVGVKGAKNRSLHENLPIRVGESWATEDHDNYTLFLGSLQQPYRVGQYDYPHMWIGGGGGAHKGVEVGSDQFA